MAQPASLYLSRQLVRSHPFASQRTFRNTNMGAAATMVAAFDVGLGVTDQNQFLTPATLPSGDTTLPAVGPFLDALVFCTGAGGGNILVEMAVDYTCSYRQIATTGVASSVGVNISGLRITGRFVRVTFTNVTAGATVEFGVYVRST